MTTRTSAQIKQELDQLREAFNAYGPMPHLPTLQQGMFAAASAALLDSAKVPEHKQIAADYESAKIKHHTHNQLAEQIRSLQTELQLVEGIEKRDTVARADQRLQASKDEFVRSAKAMVRAWRNMARVAQRNGSIPGADKGILSANLRGVIIPLTYQGDLEQILRAGPLPFEVSEREAA